MPDLMTWASPVTGGMLSWFAESTVLACLLAAMAYLGCSMSRLRLGPATRHVLWLMVLIKLAAPPLVHWPWSFSFPSARFRTEITRLDDRSVRPLVMVPTVDPGPGSTVDRGSEVEGRLLVISKENNTEIFETETNNYIFNYIDPATFPLRPSIFRGLGTLVVMVWLIGSIALILRQTRQIYRFRRLLIGSAPAPEWLIEEAAKVGRRMKVRVPEILIVARLQTPLIWCLGRPVLLIPGGLLKFLESDRWRAILAHELAHLRRRDHWVRRLELAAGLVWWWNPLYWLTLRQLDHEAELACDAWVLWASPGDRITYAESLLRICSALTTTEIAVPSLGIAGNGPSFERRLTMILSEQVDSRVSFSSVLAALMLAALSLPSWTEAEAAAAKLEPVALPTASAALEPATKSAGDPATKERPSDATSESDDDSPTAKKEVDTKKEAERAALKKKMEALGQEMEQKFGPSSEFAKKMEGLGEEIGRKFGPGSEFAKKMETLGEEMAEKFGPNSEFAKEMVANLGPDSDLGKELFKALGPDSEFAKEMKKLGLSINVTAKLDAKDAHDDARKAKEKAEELAKMAAKKRATLSQKVKEKAEEQSKKITEDAKKSREKADASRAAASVDLGVRRRERRIEALQARIEEMQKQLNQLKAETKEKDEDEDEEG